MTLSKKDRDFRFTKATYLEFKQIEMDRVLTTLLARIQHSGLPSRIRRTFDITTAKFAEEFLSQPENFSGFDKYPRVLEQWIETHLMDVVNRGKPNQVIAAPRPLHGHTYRFRNAKHCRDYGASQQIYETLYNARHKGQSAIDQLKRFFFPGHDHNTNKFDGSTSIDVETQALLALSETQVKSDAPDTSKDRDSQKSVCVGSADLMADDVIRLLVYQPYIPRSVMVDYLKILLSFHMALYHVRLFKLLPLLVKRRSADPACSPGNCPMQPGDLSDPHGSCPYRAFLLADVSNGLNPQMVHLAERSSDVHFGRITGFVRANYTLKKLSEFAENLVTKGKLQRPEKGFQIGDFLQLLEPTYRSERDAYFKMRLAGLLETSSGGSKDRAPEIEAVIDMGLSDFDTFIEIIVGLEAPGRRRNIVTALDSLMMKNDQGALLAQPRVSKSKRRIVLDSRLLEVLLQIAVLRPEGDYGFHTTEMRIEEVLQFLRERYGIYVDRLPPKDGFGEASITDREALRENAAAFKNRLREVGFYRDLSDAYVTQTVKPRYSIAKHKPVVSAEEDGA